MILRIFFYIVLIAIANNAAAQNWSALGTGVNNDVNAVTVYKGRLYAGGTFTQAGSTTVNYIAMWNGTSWEPLGTGMDNPVYALCVYNGELYAGGDFTSAGGNSANRIAKWNGNTWSGLGSGINGEVYALIRYQGALIAAGDFSNAGGNSANNIAEWNGSTWSAMGAGLNGIVRALASKGNNLTAGGEFTSNVAEWNGISWTPLGTGPGSRVNALIFYNNELIAGGEFTGGIKEWTGSAWNIIGGGLNNKVYALGEFRNLLAVGGEFTAADTSESNIILNRVTFWSGTGWSQLGEGVNDIVYALTSKDGYRLITGGKFSSAGGAPASRIAEWDKVHQISGVVTSTMDNRLVSSGKVKAIRLDSITMRIIVADSAVIQADGSYRLNNVPITPHLVIGFPDDELDGFLPTYFPSALRWTEAQGFEADTNISNVNITVKSYVRENFPGSVRGRAWLYFIPPYPEPGLLSGAVIYAKKDDTYRGFSISSNTGRFDISSLPEGNYEIIVDRPGFIGQNRNIVLNYSQGFVQDSVNFYLKPAGSIVTLNEQEVNTADEHKLHQNYPNPFNPETSIGFTLRSRALVKLSIYDFTGRRLSVLHDKATEKGSHSIKWNAQGFSTGVYFYKIDIVPLNGTAGFSETKKMLLLK